MKKIMFILSRLGGPGWGGAHKVAVMLANQLSKSGYSVYLAVSERDRVDYPVDEKIEVFTLSEMYSGSPVRLLNLIKKMWTFRKLCAEKEIDVVVGFTSNMAFYTVLATVFSKRKALISERTDPHIEPHSKLLRGMRNVIFCFADRVVFQTPGARDYFSGVVRKKSRIIPNPVSASLPEPYTGHERECRVVNFCRIAPQKNLRVLLDAFDIFWKSHPEYSLDIYGIARDGDAYKQELEAYAGTLTSGAHIRFLPGCSDVHTKVLRAKMFASSSDYEGLSNSMLESMAIGLPVVVTDCANGGERMCIDNGVNGLIVPRRNSQELAEAMARLADDREHNRNISVNSVRIKERFSAHTIFRMWEDIVEQM